MDTFVTEKNKLIGVLHKTLSSIQFIHLEIHWRTRLVDQPAMLTECALRLDRGWYRGNGQTMARGRWIAVIITFKDRVKMRQTKTPYGYFQLIIAQAHRNGLLLDVEHSTCH